MFFDLPDLLLAIFIGPIDAYFVNCFRHFSLLRFVVIPSYAGKNLINVCVIPSSGL
jgi:hypothetical protein